MANKVASLVQGDIDKLSVTKTSWGEQFRDAMNVNGGDLETAKASHYIGHALAFFWKVINDFLEKYRICSNFKFIDRFSSLLFHQHRLLAVG